MENQTNINEVDVLMVEDSPNDAELISRALSKINIANKIYWVKDGEEALEFIFCTGRYSIRNAAINPLKVILLDLKLPKVNGLEVAAKIKANEHTKTIPVVIVTSSQEDRDLKEAYKLGVNSYIVKPIDAANFVKALSEAGLYWLAINKPLIKL
ncbi:MAG TPA: response regulator [Candidatus Paceibacterota bacterium]|jgi:CheY-like chemotaxis protein|nr:response regulator [Candidatus Paceibacterota bacterium]